MKEIRINQKLIDIVIFEENKTYLNEIMNIIGTNGSSLVAGVERISSKE